MKISKITINFMNKIGLNNKEIEVYVWLLKFRGRTVMEIGRGTGIKRSTCHNIVESLKNKGFIIESYSKTGRLGNKRFLESASPARFGFYLKDKIHELEQLYRDENFVINELEGIGGAK